MASEAMTVNGMHDPKLGMEKLARKDIIGTTDKIEIGTVDLIIVLKQCLIS